MKILKKVFWLFKAFLANLFYAFPSRHLFLIGVTGTDGKTTTTALISHLLQKLGEKVDYISTVGANIAGKDSDIGFHVTTPRFFELQKLLRRSVTSKAKYFVLEITSHAIDQQRIWGCHFKIAALTNITNEHLDYHKSFNDYAKIKLRLINAADTAVVNTEPSTYYRYKNLIRNKNVWYTSLNKKTDTTYPQLQKLGIRDDFTDFEKENVLLAFTVGRILGYSAISVVKAINTFERVKGRLDYFSKDGRHFLVDFAHTPNAFLQLFKSIEKAGKYRRIIHVFGCAGLRDKIKRPKMGQFSGRYAQMIIITEEDYRSEKLLEINQKIEEGIKKNKQHQAGKTYFFIDSRQEAINFAVKNSKPADLIVLTGKAHEKSLARGAKEDSWDEYQAIDNALAKLAT